MTLCFSSAGQHLMCFWSARLNTLCGFETQDWMLLEHKTAYVMCFWSALLNTLCISSAGLNTLCVFEAHYWTPYGFGAQDWIPYVFLKRRTEHLMAYSTHDNNINLFLLSTHAIHISWVKVYFGVSLRFYIMHWQTNSSANA